VGAGGEIADALAQGNAMLAHNRLPITAGQPQIWLELPQPDTGLLRCIRRSENEGSPEALDGYLTNQSAWLVDYAERHRAGLRVGTAITEGTANFLVNRRMNKSQQMRWSRRGADLLLQVRCAIYNGTLGSGFGQKFQPANDPCPTMATAA
jgi:hypothetical protein